MRLFADAQVSDLFGQVTPPPGSPTGDAPTVIAKFLSVGIQLVLMVGALMLLFFLLWGGLDWLTSAGDKDKLAKAQGKIINAIVGMLLVVAALAIFTLVNGTILGNRIIDTTGGKWTIVWPTVAP